MISGQVPALPANPILKLSKIEKADTEKIAMSGKKRP
jgi:hypothetical protein